MTFSCRVLLALAFLLALARPVSATETSFSTQGVSRPLYNAQLSFAVPGSVYTIPVKPGERIKAGSLLMQLDTRPEEFHLALLNTEIASDLKIRTLSTRVEQARLDMQRFQSALDHKAATTMEAQHAALAYKLSELALDEERFRVSQLKISREELAAQRDRMRLVAPCDGYVEDILVERGMAVDKNTPALRLVSIDPMQVELNLPVEQVAQLHVGDAVEVQHPGSATVVKGVVSQIARIAVLSNRTLRVRITAPNPESRPMGLMVNVRFRNMTPPPQPQSPQENQ